MVGFKVLKLKRSANVSLALLLMIVSLALSTSSTALADTTQSGAIGIEGTIPSAPPSRGATISTPGNGQSFTTEPITVSGICPTGLLIKVFDNNVFVGSAVCTNASYSVQVNLFSGTNTITVIDYDSLSQAGPTSNAVTVTYNNAQFSQFGTHLTLSSSYAEKGAAPGSQISWPILLSGGTAPYAISVDWGDGSSSELISQSLTGTFNISHTYNVAGVYTVIVKATDKNGEEAFLQLVGQATGAVQHNDKSSGTNQIIQKKVEWWPALFILPAVIAAFWLGYKYGTAQFKKYF